MKSSNIQAILHQLNTCITCISDGIHYKLWYCMNTYYISRCGFIDAKIRLKDIKTLLSNSINIDIAATEGYGNFNIKHLTIEQ